MGECAVDLLRGLTDVTDVMDVRTAGRLLLGSSCCCSAARLSFTSPPASTGSKDTCTACKELVSVKAKLICTKAV